MKNEIWKDVPGYEGFYQVSNIGRVKSLKRKGVRNEKILKPIKDNSGYLRCNLSRNGVIKKHNIHQLVAMAFLGHKPDGHKIVVDHIDNVQTDNRLENLQLITTRENLSKDKSGGTSSYPGVSYKKSRKKWVAQMHVYGRKKSLGYFDKEEEAARYYQNALKAIKEGTEIKVKKHEWSSKYKGVSWCNFYKKWLAHYYSNGKNKYIGRYKSEEEAYEARQLFHSQLKQQKNEQQLQQ